MYLYVFCVNMMLVMIMKKTISITMMLLVFILSFSFLVYAEDPVVLSIQDEKVYAGDDFTINVFVSENSQLSGAVIDVNYDNEKIEFISAKEGGILDTSGNVSLCNISGDKGCVRFTYISTTSPISTKGILFSVTFRALDTSIGKTNIEITVPNPADFVNSDLEKIPLNIENAEITILENVSIDTTTKPEITESTNHSEPTDVIQSESTVNDINDKENTEKNNMIFMIVLLLIGLSIVCFGVVFIIKKKK